MDDKYGQYVHQIQQFLQRLKTTKRVSTSETRSTDVNVNLPKLNLPVFSGGYMEWKSFFDLFKGAVINNTRLTKSQNLQHLKSSLTRDGDKLLHSITITEDNFHIAIDILEIRYDNKRLILRSHLHEIFKQRSLTSENSKDLRTLMETTEENRLALLNRGQPVDQQDTFFVYLLTERLSIEARKGWKISTPRREPQRYDQLEEHHLCDRHQLVINSSTRKEVTWHQKRFRLI